MNYLKTVWHWLSQEGIQKTLATVIAILTLLTMVIGGAWQAYLHFSEKPKDTPTTTISASSGGMAAGGDIMINNGLNQEQYENVVKQGIKEVLDALTEIHLNQNSPVDKKKIEQLEKQLTDMQAKLKDPKAALGDYKAILEQSSKALDHFKDKFPPEQVEKARQSLAKGDTKPAEMLFQQVFLVPADKENAAKAAYQLGQLAYGRFDYEAADRYYRKARDLEPNNPFYIQNQPEKSLSINRQGNPIIKFSSREKDNGNHGDFELIVSYKGSEIYRGESSLSDPLGDYEGKRRLLEDTPKSGCQTIVAPLIAGAKGYASVILGTSCGVDDYLTEADIGIYPDGGNFLNDIDKDGVKEIAIRNEMPYYQPDKNHSLSYAESPLMYHYALWTSRGWKITQPGDLKSVYEKLLNQELQKKVEPYHRVAKAITVTYYALMAGEDEDQARKLLLNQLPKDWKGIANTVFLDIKKSISKMISGKYLTTIIANTEQSASR